MLVYLPGISTDANWFRSRNGQLIEPWILPFRSVAQLCLSLFNADSVEMVHAGASPPGVLSVDQMESSDPQTNRTAMIGFRVEPYVKEAAERAAAKDRRSLSSLMVKILNEFLSAQRLLP